MDKNKSVVKSWTVVEFENWKRFRSLDFIGLVKPLFPREPFEEMSSPHNILEPFGALFIYIMKETKTP